MTKMKKLSDTPPQVVTVAGKRTSVRMDPASWGALRDIAAVQNRSINELVTEIDSHRDWPLSTAIRIYIVEYYRARITAAPVN